MLQHYTEDTSCGEDLKIRKETHDLRKKSNIP